MNTQQLRCFMCVADKLNFTKAAEELFLSAPTVTHHIQSLETELDTKLFIRNKRFVRLTEAGMVFYNDAQDILAKFDLAKEHAEKMNQKKSSIIRIGCSSNAELEKLTEVLTLFREEFTEVYPRIMITNYSQLVNMLNDKQADIVFGTKDMMKDFSGYTFKTIRKMSSFALVSDSNPLSQREELSFADLETSRLIILHPKMIPFKYGSEVQENIRRRSTDHLDIVCENDQAGIAMAAAGYGIAILPDFCIPKDVNHRNIVKIRLSKGDDADYGIGYQSKGKEAAVKEFIRLCMNIFA